MPWDLELNVAAPATVLYQTLAYWYRYPRLRAQAAVEDYTVIKSDGRNEHFWLKVRDIPLKASFCYGRRLMRHPLVVVTVFTYRFLRSRRLEGAIEIDNLMHRKWESFFYQTAWLRPLAPELTRLLVNEPGGYASDSPLSEIEDFFATLGRIAETESGRREQPVDDGLVGVAESPWEAPGDEDRTFALPWEAGEGRYDPYTILGLSGGVNLAEVKRAYRALALRYHPDRLVGRSAAEREYAHNRFIEVTAAYHSILRSHGL